MANTLDEVENQFSGVPKNPDPGLRFDGRMYAPQPDNIRRSPNGGIEARTRRNRIFLGPDGSIRIEDLKGTVIFSKPGGA